MIGGPKGAAARLGLKRTTLIHKMQKLGISRPRPQSIQNVVEMSSQELDVLPRVAFCSFLGRQCCPLIHYQEKLRSADIDFKRKQPGSVHRRPPQCRLYFLPEPHSQGCLKPNFASTASCRTSLSPHQPVCPGPGLDQLHTPIVGLDRGNLVASGARNVSDPAVWSYQHFLR